VAFFRHDKFRVFRCKPRSFLISKLAKSLPFVLIGPDDKILSGWRTAMVDPAVPESVMDLHRNDFQLLCEVGDCVVNFRKWFRSSVGSPKSMEASAEARGHNRAISISSARRAFSAASLK
jgi:hypothetical protein